jgi:cytochrome c oxidase subunit 2
MTEPAEHDESAAVAARFERRWAILSVVIIVALAFVAAYAGLHQGVMPQAGLEIADPTRLHLAGEFIESNLGTAEEPDGSVTVRAIGQQYSFTPPCLVVPADTPVTLRATSADLVHGLLIEGTNVNTMLAPGYVSVLSVRFDKPGDHLMPCHEFCSVGHEGMWAQVRVVDKAAFRAMSAGRRRVSCAE